LTNRVAFERLLYDIYEAYTYEVDGDIRRAIDESKEYSEKIRYEAAQEYPKKLPLDQALRGDQKIREAVWDYLGIDKDTPYPFLPADILDGPVTDNVYKYYYPAVLMSDDAPTDYAKFFGALAKYREIDFEIFSAVAAVAGQYLDKPTKSSY